MLLQRSHLTRASFEQPEASEFGQTPSQSMYIPCKKKRQKEFRKPLGGDSAKVWIRWVSDSRLTLKPLDFYRQILFCLFIYSPRYLSVFTEHLLHVNVELWCNAVNDDIDLNLHLFSAVRSVGATLTVLLLLPGGCHCLVVSGRTASYLCAWLESCFQWRVS